MDMFEQPYTREDAIKEGRLIHVSHLNRKEFNPFVTYISVGLWNACQREGPRRLAGRRHRSRRPRHVGQEERIRQVITLVPLIRWLEKGKHGEFTMYYDTPDWLRYPLPLRVVVEPDEDYGRVVTILLEAERLDFGMPRPPNGGSFFVM